MILSKKEIFRKRGAHLVTAIAATCLSLVSCSDDMFDSPQEYEANKDGVFEGLEISIPFDTEAGDAKTRARAGFNMAGLELNSAWVAMFDSSTGSMVTMGDATFDSKDNGDVATNHPSKPQAGYSVKVSNIGFYDSNNTVYIVGVGNYEDIMVRTRWGNDTLLIDALRSVENMEDYKRIAVNNASAEAAMAKKGNAPLMSGFWGTGHGNFTIDNKGKLNTNNTVSTDPIPIYDPADMKVKDSHVKHIQEDGVIHLRRLYSHINVTVDVDESNFEKFENPTVEVVNVPRFTFLQEHTTVTELVSDDVDNNEEWLQFTHTAADLFEDGYYDTTGEIYPGKLMNPYDSGFVMNTGLNTKNEPYNDALTVTSASGKTTLKFGYWHYEAKHWAYGKVSNQNEREKRFDGTEIYSSLCPSAKMDFNNKATYFILRADVKSKDGYEGRAAFYIHEGFCCQSNGEAATSESQAVPDFSTFRNVDYTYNVKINGMNSLVTKVSKNDFDDSGAYAGVGGEIWSSKTRSTSLPKGESSYTIGLPEGKFYWAIEENGKIYGVPLDDENLRVKYSAYPHVTESDFSASKFYNLITIDGQALGDVLSISEDTNARLSFGSDDSLDAKLYIVGLEKSSDGLATLYTVYQFDKSGNRLDTPEITLPYASNPKRLVMGLDDHTIRWKKDDDAKKYRIELVKDNGMGGYYVEFDPNTDTNKDLTDANFIASGKTITGIRLEEDSEGYLYYRMRYANSVGALMNFLNTNEPVSAQVTIKVTAYGEDGVEPQSGTYTMTIVNPFWDLNAVEWQTAIGALKTGTATSGSSSWDGLLANQTATVDGMSLHTGGKADMQYVKTGNTYVIQPHGSGSSPVTSSNPQRYFGFRACTRGKTRAWGSSTSSSKNSDASKARHMVTAFTGGSPVTSETDASSSPTGTPIQLKDMSNITPTPSTFSGTTENIFMYSDADIRIYKLQFVPEDENRGTK